MLSVIGDVLPYIKNKVDCSKFDIDNKNSVNE